MKVRFESLPKTHVVGIPLEMTLAENKTRELWQAFMPLRAGILERTSTDYLSMQIYPESNQGLFDPTSIFTKWACVEVSNDACAPDSMQTYTINGGLYAVFDHHGPASKFAQSFGYIFNTWLPISDYDLDAREHFEKLPEDYNPLDEQAFEEIWIPIKPK